MGKEKDEQIEKFYYNYLKSTNSFEWTITSIEFSVYNKITISLGELVNLLPIAKDLVISTHI